jgi:glutathione peroxidase-family protein
VSLEYTPCCGHDISLVLGLGMGLQILQIIGKDTTDVYPLTHSLIEQLDRKLLDLVIKWHSMSYGGELKIQKYNGSLIHYQGIAYAGTAVTVFWGDWMREYLNNESLKIANDIAQTAQKANYDVKKCVDESIELLCIMASRVYDKMADVDSKLRGDGINFEQLRDVSGYKSNFEKHITSHAKIIVDQFSSQVSKEKADSDRQDIFDMKPNFYGFGVNLNECWRRVRRCFKKEA